MNFSLEIGPKTDIETVPAVSDVYITMLPRQHCNVHVTHSRHCFDIGFRAYFQRKIHFLGSLFILKYVSRKFD